MPTAGLLRAVLQSVMIERGYGVFVSPVTCDAWSFLHDSALKQNKAALLLFSFTGPMLSPWQGVFLSFPYQGKVKRKKPDSCFLLEAMLHYHIPRRVALFPFCSAIPVLSNDTAKRSPPWGATSSAGDRSKLVVTSKGVLDPSMQKRFVERFTSVVSKGRILGSFDRCPFPNEWSKHQARATLLDTCPKDKYESSRFYFLSGPKCAL